MDVFVEQIVKKRKTGRDGFFIGLIFFGLFVVLFLMLYFLEILLPLLPITFLVLCGIGFGMYWLISSFNVEFEYSVTNGDIDIDQIIARRKRKRIVSVAGHKVESLERYDPKKFSARPFGRRVMAAPSEYEQELWCFTYYSKKNGKTLVIFQPEKRVLTAMLAGLPKLVQMDAKKQLPEEE